MPGPKMGPRPADFDEEVIRQSPTFIRWDRLAIGEKLRYACREFVKGQGDDEERLMRRIMIARRNNLKDHQTLKRARQIANKKETEKEIEHERKKRSKMAEVVVAMMKPIDSNPNSTSRKRRPSTLFSDSEVAKEMDVPAVEATRSYQAWLDLPDGAEFVYNQKYVKGREGHDWLLRKNIWRRMRYRRENKKMVEELRHEIGPPNNSSVQLHNGGVGFGMLGLDDIQHQHQQQHSQSQQHHHLHQQPLSTSSPTSTASAAAMMMPPNSAAAAAAAAVVMSSRAVASQIVDQALLAAPTGGTDVGTNASELSEKLEQVIDSVTGPAPAHLVQTGNTNDDANAAVDGEDNTHFVEVNAAVEAAVAVAESYVKSPYNMVHNPLEATHATTAAALDAAARLAAAQSYETSTAAAAPADSQIDCGNEVSVHEAVIDGTIPMENPNLDPMPNETTGASTESTTKIEMTEPLPAPNVDENGSLIG